MVVAVLGQVTAMFDRSPWAAIFDQDSSRKLQEIPQDDIGSEHFLQMHVVQNGVTAYSAAIDVQVTTAPYMKFITTSGGSSNQFT